MKWIYRQAICRSLVLFIWIITAFSIYSNNRPFVEPNESNRDKIIAARNMETQTDEITTASVETPLEPARGTETAELWNNDDDDDDGVLEQSSDASFWEQMVSPTVRADKSSNSSKELSGKLTGINSKIRRYREKLLQSTTSSVIAKSVISKQTTRSSFSTEESSILKSRLTPTSDRIRTAQVNAEEFLRIKRTSTPNSIISKTEMESERKRVDPMDEYKDMGGIGFTNNSGSIVINPHPFNFTLNPSDVCGLPTAELFLLIYIHTRPENIRHRQLIRNTWGNTDAYGLTVRRVFVMGLPSKAITQDAIKLESSLYQDVLQEDFLDSYRNMTYKALGALKWVASHCAHAKFILKTDDDIFVNTHLLIEKLVKLSTSAGGVNSRSLMCNVWYGSAVARQGKWATTIEQRKHPTWPPFCQGLAYVMTSDLPGAFFNASLDVPFLWMDDVYVTGFLSRRLGVVFKQLSQFFVVEGDLRRLLESPTQWKKVLFSHVHNFDLSKWAWQKVEKLINSPRSIGVRTLNTTGTTTPKVN